MLINIPFHNNKKPRIRKESRMAAVVVSNFWVPPANCRQFFFWMIATWKCVFRLQLGNSPQIQHYKCTIFITKLSSVSQNIFNKQNTNQILLKWYNDTMIQFLLSFGAEFILKCVLSIVLLAIQCHLVYNYQNIYYILNTILNWFVCGIHICKFK